MKKILIIAFLFSSFLSAQTVIDSYPESNYGSAQLIYATGTVKEIGQSFTAIGLPLISSKFYLKKGGSPTGKIISYLYNHAGSYGSSSMPTGSPIAMSDSVDISGLTTENALITFTFSTPYNLTNGSNYVITVKYLSGDPSNNLYVGLRVGGASHSGNECYYTTSWYYNTNDLIFYVYGTSPTTFIPIITID